MLLNRQTYEGEYPNAKFLFQTIYQSACRLDKNSHDITAWLTINDLLSDGVNIDLIYNGFSPVGLLAKEGKDKGVDILLNEFHASISDAIECYAAAGNKKVVDRLLEAFLEQKDYKPLHRAITGAAKGGQDDLVQYLVTRGYEIRNTILQVQEYYPGSLSGPTMLSCAVLGYAFAGNTPKINEMIEKGGSDVYALEGYALAGNIDALKNMIPDQRFSFYAEKLCAGLDHAGYIEKCVRQGDTTLLRLFAICDDASRDNLRKALQGNGIPPVGPPNGTPMPASIIRREENRKLFNALITELENIMQTYQMTFIDAYKIYLFKSQYQLSSDQAYAWSAPELRFWLLQGIQKTSDQEIERIIPDVFFHIASFLTKLDDVETNLLFQKMHFAENKRLLLNGVKNVLSEEQQKPQANSKSSDYARHCRFFEAVSATQDKTQLCRLLEKQDQCDQFYKQAIESVYRRLK